MVAPCFYSIHRENEYIMNHNFSKVVKHYSLEVLKDGKKKIHV